MDNIEETLSEEEIMELDLMVDEILNDEGTQEEPVTIRRNSPTILIDEQQSRFNSAVWFEKIRKSTIALGGLGGIGSWTNLLLSRLKPEYIYLYDPDTFEQANMSGQFCGSNNMCAYKVNVAHEYAKQFSSYYSCVAYREYFTEHHLGRNIMMCGFDNMAARRIFYNAWKKHVYEIPESDRKYCLYIDGRLNCEEFQILCIRGTDTYRMKEYEEKWLFSDEEADETVCSYKQTSHIATMIASMMVNLFTNHMANMCGVLVERDVPFLTYYNAETMYLKTES